MPPVVSTENRASVAVVFDDNTPRFQQIAESIGAKIEAGDWPEHTPLPSERDVAEENGVSRMTARRALEALELKGLVYSEERRGRFVSPQRLTYNVSNMVSFVKDAQATHTDLEIEVIDALESKADAKLAEKLMVEVGCAIYQYTRLFRSKGHAIFLETESILAGKFPGFLDYDLHQSTTNLLESNYGTCPQSGDIIIRMCGVDEHEARHLGLAINQAVIELEQVVRDGGDRPFCFGRQLWRGELAEFTVRAIVNGEVTA